MFFALLPPICPPACLGPRCFSDASCPRRSAPACQVDGFCGQKGPGTQGFNYPCLHDTYCSKGLLCLAGAFCGNPGRKGDTCQRDKQCRNGFYCDPKRLRCREKKVMGTKCQEENECLSGICIRGTRVKDKLVFTIL